MKRPLVVCAIALIWGIILSDVNISHWWGFITVVMSLMAFLIFYRPLRGKESAFLLVAIPFLITGYGLHSINKNYYDTVLMPWQNTKSAVLGRVFDEPEFMEGKTRFTIDVQSIANGAKTQSTDARILATVYSDDPFEEIRYGSYIQIEGEIKNPQGKRNLGGFNAKKFMAAREISGSLAVSKNAVTLLDGNKVSWLKKTGYSIRHTILDTLNKHLPAKEASFLAGILIGYTSDMPEEMEEDFRRAGLSHVLAVSGANIAFLLLPLLLLLKYTGFNRRWSSAIAFPLMLFYVFATGMEASVVRAAIMAGVTLIGMLFWRKSDIYCSMAVSAIIILINNSFMLYDLGFILSFSATLSLVVFYRPIYEKLSAVIPKTIRNTLAGTIAAQIGVIPVIVYNFNTFSVVSIFSNLLIVPLTGVLTILGALLSIAGAIHYSLGNLLSFITLALADIILFLTENVAKIPWAEINIATPNMILIVMYYLLFIYIRYGHPKLPRDISGPFLAAIIMIFGVTIVLAAVPRHTLSIYFADVGQGDCILIRTPKGKNIIIDGGGSIYDEEESYAGEHIVVPLLYDLNMTKIDLMIATHGHADHIGGLKSVLDKVPVESLFVADAPDTEMRELTDYAEKKGIMVNSAKEGVMLIKEDGLTIKALYPLQEEWLMPNGVTTNANELSLVACLEYGDFNALFTGDIGEETEMRLLADGNLTQYDVIKIAHHGSKYSSSETFINMVRPKVAVISVGNNRYGHPDSDLIDRLTNMGAQVYQTQQNGGVLVEAWQKQDSMRITTVIND